MIKNINETISLITLIIILIFTLKVGIGLIFSSDKTGTVKGNWNLLKDYINNTEE